MLIDWGGRLKIIVFGRSHDEAIGVTVEGFPSGETVDMDALMRFIARRRAKADGLSTARREGDAPVFLSGLADGATTNQPLTAVIYNNDVRPSDYDDIADTPRPSHADYGAYMKWHGSADMSGGGQFSGRLTAPLCVAGGIALEMLERRGVAIAAHLASVGDICDAPLPLLPERGFLRGISAKAFPVIDDDIGRSMMELIRSTAGEGDSVGGVVECAAVGMPAGIGGAMCDGLESRIAYGLFGIPAVKGVEFGSGFAGSRAKGSMNNDPFVVRGGEVYTLSNNSGGILGGISSGMPIIVRAAIKPTPSIALPQQTVSLSHGENTEIKIKGRHDPCIAHRAVPVVEAMTALCLLDALLSDEGYGR